MTFRGKTITLQEDPRCGVCNGCRAVLGQIDAQTGKFYYGYYQGKGFDLHHEFYDWHDVMAYTIELRRVCHGKYNKEQKIFSYKCHRDDPKMRKLFYRNYSTGMIIDSRLVRKKENDN